MTPEPIEEEPYFFNGRLVAIVIVLTLLICMFSTAYIVNFIAAAANSSPLDDEHQEYLQIRDYSNCTKANDSVCLGGCVHTYRMCQIEHCGKEGIGW
jgi:hypothetical protein